MFAAIVRVYSKVALKPTTARTTLKRVIVIRWDTLGEMRQYYMKRVGVIVARSARRHPNFALKPAARCT